MRILMISMGEQSEEWRVVDGWAWVLMKRPSLPSDPPPNEYGFEE